ncbi:hypothetical protein LXL04_026039 [Taraxacum kok-saghyz]
MASSYLPDEILHNILTRLPSKALLQSRCVSKHWNRLISEPFFMNSRSRRKLLLSTSRLDLHLIDHDTDNVPVITDDMAHSTVNFRPLFGGEKGGEHITIAGTFNGIVLLVLHDPLKAADMILYNPLTRALTNVPDPTYPFNNDASSYAFGFGNDELKIIRIEVHESFDGPNWGTFHVFDLKNSVWSSQEFVPAYDFYNDMAGVFINGFLYWVAFRNFDKVILALDVKKMVFSTLDLPHGCDLMTNFLLRNECNTLWMICRSFIGNNFDVWVMKDLKGVENSWSKACSLTCNLEDDCLCFGFQYSSCIYILDQGRFLMMDGHGRLFIYDTLKGPRGTRIGLKDDLLNYRHQVHGIEYVESLVSPSDILGF